MTEVIETIAIFAAVAASMGALARTSLHRGVHAIGLPLLLAGWVGLLVALSPEPVRDRWPLALAAALVAGPLVALLARRLAGHERWLLAAGGAVLTLRVPVPTGDGSAMLLAPLYSVIGVGAVTLLLPELRAAAATRLRLADRGGSTRLLGFGVAAIPVLATMSLIWSVDRESSMQSLAFFLIPFVILYSLVSAWASSGVDLRPAAWAIIASAMFAAVVGLYQAATQQVWWNPKVIEANRFRADFRTNSIFWDPNIYGRALVVALLAIVAWLLVVRVTRRSAIGASLAAAVLVMALWNSYSQSSWVSLAAALVMLAVLTLPPRARRWAASALVIGVLVSLPIAADRLGGADASGRGEVVRTGVSLAAERPILGWGIGSFEAAARARAQERGDRDPGLTASHTTPVTVIAELGVLGAFTYLLLLTSAIVAVLARWRRVSSPAAAARARGDIADAGTGWPIPALAWASATLVVLVAHSLLYAGFFEDATLWVALAILASLPTPATDDDRLPADVETTIGAPEATPMPIIS